MRVLRSYGDWSAEGMVLQEYDCRVKDRDRWYMQMMSEGVFLRTFKDKYPDGVAFRMIMKDDGRYWVQALIPPSAFLVEGLAAEVVENLSKVDSMVHMDLEDAKAVVSFILSSLDAKGLKGPFLQS